MKRGQPPPNRFIKKKMILIGSRKGKRKEQRIMILIALKRIMIPIVRLREARKTPIAHWLLEGKSRLGFLMTRVSRSPSSIKKRENPEMKKLEV